MNIDYITACGHAVNFSKPENTRFDWEDIRIHTENLNRYNGALKWSLIQHLYLCTELVSILYPEHPDQELLKALVAAHDLHEIYIGDVVSGLKKYLPEYVLLEEEWEKWIHKTLDISWEDRNRLMPEVRQVDITALVLEMTQLQHPAAQLVQRKYNVNPYQVSYRKAFDSTVFATNIGCIFKDLKTLIVEYSLKKQKENYVG